MTSSSRLPPVIGRLVVAFALLVFAALVYIGIVVVLGSMAGAPAQHPSALLAVIATAVVALTLPAIRRRVGRFVLAADREQQLAAITGEMSAAVPVETMLPLLAEAVGKATSARTVEIRVRPTGSSPTITRWPADPPPADNDREAADRTIRAGPTTHAELIVFPKRTRSGRPRRFTQAERRLLERFVARVGLPIENVELHRVLRREVAEAAERAERVRASRRQVVEASELERHRLERNIHDGAQQHLVALSVRLGLVRALCDSNPSAAGAALEDLPSGVARATAELDDLGRGVYPRALREAGLSAALEELGAAAAPTVRVSVPPTRSRWPHELEGAVYFTCSEAVQNAVKHARADRIDVRLRVGDDGLTFEVSDDGVGIEQGPTTVGTGLRGLTERIEAIGGWIRVSTSPGHGTTVTGFVPLPAIGV